VQTKGCSQINPSSSGNKGGHCDPWTDKHTQATEFIEAIACMDARDFKFAMVAEHAEDKDKVHTIVQKISDMFYPGVKNTSGYQPDINNHWWQVWCGDGSWNSASRRDIDELKSFKQLRHQSLETADDLQQYVSSSAYGTAGNPYLWGAIVFNRIPGAQATPPPPPRCAARVAN
jgi:hypothetical protein